MAVQHVVKRLLYLCDTIPAKIRLIPDAELITPRAAGKWSKQQILGHLVDSATNNHHRFIRARLETVPVITYNGDFWVNAQHYQEMDRAQLLLFWEYYNRHLAVIISVIKEEDLQKTCNNGDPAPHTLQFLIEDYVRHLEHHLMQLIPTLSL